MPLPSILDLAQFLAPKERRNARVANLRISPEGVVTFDYRFSRVPDAFPADRIRMQNELTAYIQQGTPLSQATIRTIGPSYINEVLAFAASRPLPGPPELPPGAERDVGFSPIEGGRQFSPPGEEFFMPHVSIPGGVAGMAQQTRATLARVGGSLGLRGRGGTRRKRRSARVATGSRKARRASPRRKRSGGKRKYNSAAWMAKIRKMRKRK